MYIKNDADACTRECEFWAGYSDAFALAVMNPGSGVIICYIYATCISLVQAYGYTTVRKKCRIGINIGPKNYLVSRPTL